MLCHFLRLVTNSYFGIIVIHMLKSIIIAAAEQWVRTGHFVEEEKEASLFPSTESWTHPSPSANCEHVEVQREVLQAGGNYEVASHVVTGNTRWPVSRIYQQNIKCELKTWCQIRLTYCCQLVVKLVKLVITITHHSCKASLTTWETEIGNANWRTTLKYITFHFLFPEGDFHSN